MTEETREFLESLKKDMIENFKLVFDKIDSLEKEMISHHTYERETRVLLENAFERSVRAIAEGHSNIIRRFDELNDYPAIRERISIAETVQDLNRLDVKQNTADIEELKKKVALSSVAPGR
jgi:transposase-like protein